MNALLWAMVAYALVEFAFVTNAGRAQRESVIQRSHWPSSARGYAGHAGLYAGALGLTLWLTQSTGLVSVLLCTLLLVLIHVGIEVAETYAAAHLLLTRPLAAIFGTVNHGLYRVALFLAAQSLHFFAFRWAVGLVFPPVYDLSQLTWYVRNHLMGPAPVTPADQLPYVLLLLILSTFGAAELIRLLVQVFAPTEPARKVTVTRTVLTENARSGSTTAAADAMSLQLSARTQRTEEHEEPVRGTAGSGRWIGILERMLVIMLVSMNAWQGIAFVFTAKSLARYKQLDNRDFAEYYIVGTLISILIGITAGLLVGEALGTLK